MYKIYLHNLYDTVKLNVKIFNLISFFFLSSAELCFIKQEK